FRFFFNLSLYFFLSFHKRFFSCFCFVFGCTYRCFFVFWRSFRINNSFFFGWTFQIDFTNCFYRGYISGFSFYNFLLAFCFFFFFAFLLFFFSAAFFFFAFTFTFLFFFTLFFLFAF